MTKFSYEQCALADVSVGGRFVEKIFGATDKRRFYVVVKHFMGWRITTDEDGVKSRSDEKIPKTKVKYISYDGWITTTWEDHNEDGSQVMVMKMTET